MNRKVSYTIEITQSQEPYPSFLQKDVQDTGSVVVNKYQFVVSVIWQYNMAIIKTITERFGYRNGFLYYYGFGIGCAGKCD